MKSRYLFTSLVLIPMGLIPLAEMNFAPAPNHLPFLGCEQIPQDTPGPIDIVTKDARFIETKKPLHFTFSPMENGLVNQTGQSVEILLNQPFTVGVLTGGILYNEVYRFKKIRFYWQNNITNSGHYAATTVDGRHGTRLETVIYYYNQKYGSFENALNYRDGLAEILIRVNVGKIPNPLFFPLQYKMKKIKKPGDSINIISGISYLWSANFAHHSTYYAYPGSYPDEKTGKTYYSTTTMVMPLSAENFISFQQFEDTFGSLVDFSRKPLINAAPQYPRGSLPVVQAEGIVLVNV